jgi:clan AA aspartic protease (TIGR02281 family)
MKKLGDSPDDYVSVLIELADKMEEAASQYAALAADETVKQRLIQLNEKAGPRVRLGPSDQFKEELPWVRRQREKVNSAVIKFSTQDGGVPQVKVTVNGKTEIRMIVDSGASIVTLTSDVADRLGLKPGPGDPVTHLVLADGKVTDAKLMTLKSVRLGGFTVENVPCAIHPSSVKGADCLLGGTFLRNFICRIDLATGELRLSQMSGSPPAKSLVTNAAHSLMPVSRTEIIVRATQSETNAVSTGIHRNKGESFVIAPSASDTWAKGEGSHDGKRCDYKGYADKPGWMALKWKIGNTAGLVTAGATIAAPEAGELLLFCNDDAPAENGGAIRAEVLLK